MDGLARRSTIVAAGLIGAAGVAAAAASSHGDTRNLAAIAAVCLSHGPALLALSHYRGRWFTISGLVLAIGTLVFAADLGLREWAGMPLFPGAAPIGGGLMIVGWLVAAVAGIGVAPRQQ
jgi:uncharacterized membrane protein YgdD (TMEM256/DUF423 family)